MRYTESQLTAGGGEVRGAAFYPMKTTLLALLGLSFCVAASAGQPVLDSVDNGRGSVDLLVPSSYDPEQPLPLIVVLHGYGGTGTSTANYLGLPELAEPENFLIMAPNGSAEPDGSFFWNATDACCNFVNSTSDDSGYLRGLVQRVQERYSVDPASIHFIGYSNGGFMAHRLACEHSDLVASVASLAGATFDDADICMPENPVHVLQIHGTNDEIIAYDGGSILGDSYPSAPETVASWVLLNNCSATGRSGGPAFNLDFLVPGDETTAEVWDTDCDPGGSAELWTLDGSFHGPVFQDVVTGDIEFGQRAVDWLLEHRKPEIASDTQAINYGLAGGWFNESTPGQGFLFDFLLQDQFMFVAAFTFDTLGRQPGGNIAGAEQRWFTAQGNYQGDRADLTIFQSRNGVFDDPAAVESTAVGTMVIEFHSCTRATITYDLPGLGLSGTIPVSKLLADTLCSRINSGEITVAGKAAEKGAQQDLNYGMIGGWFNPDTAGQGFLFDFQPDTRFMFVAAFTFDAAAEQKGMGIPGAEQRWFTAQGSYQGSRAELTLFQTRGGVFDDAAPVTTEAVGTLTVEALGCTTAEVRYELPELGLSGAVSVTKLLADEICSEINSGDINLGGAPGR
ncbi:MAG: alpha/beta hydrolase-fold protein [Xanthomonadales bacterium]|nr:alpha/beta hydrolase-fold protein [Xanthomonadales bacterium]